MFTSIRYQNSNTKSFLNYILSRFCYYTGYRFPKSHRQEESILYRAANTTLANLRADDKKEIAPPAISFIAWAGFWVMVYIWISI